MGASYVNITVKGRNHPEIAAFLRQSDRSAFVTPTTDGISVVYDSKLLAGCDVVVAATLAGALASQFRCVTMLAYVFKSDFFVYVLYEAGREVDRYNSYPNYPEPVVRVPPIGGDAAKLCRAFGLDVPRRLIPDSPVVIIDRILRRYDLPDEADSYGPVSRGFVYEDDRHRALLNALHLPEWIANTGYEMFSFAEYPTGFPAAGMVKVG